MAGLFDYTSQNNQWGTPSTGFQIPQWGAGASASSPQPAGAVGSFAAPTAPALGSGMYGVQPWSPTNPNMTGAQAGEVASYTDTSGSSSSGPGALGYTQMGLNGLQTLGNLWGAWQTNKLANKAFDFQKGMAETNLANSIKSYNSKLEDHAASLQGVSGWSDQQKADYISRNRL